MLIVKPSLVVIKDSKIHYFNNGGILIWNNSLNSIKITNNKICNNGYGIHCVGDDGSAIIESNYIEYNMLNGIRIGIANKSRVY